MLCKVGFLLSLCSVVLGGDPATRVVLPQGVLTGVRMLTDRRAVVTAYLGIPYALPPLGPYRFAPPERHPGWNDSLVAEHFRPDCLQPRQSGAMRTTSEDCLYLNVFVPAGGQLNQFPVLVFLESTDFVTGSPRVVEAQELAAEGVIVVTLSFRLNVFGFLSFGDASSRGNLGLLDQYLALLWVKENTPHFGGRADVTVMGHGAGASAVVAHMTSPRTLGLFTRAIIMSGSVFSPIYQPNALPVGSRSISRSLGCRGDPTRTEDTITMLTCLRQKSSDELLRAFENIHKNANWTNPFVPIADNFLPEMMQYLPLSPAESMTSGHFMQIPILTGLTVNEGTVLLDRWEELKNQPDTSLLHFINNTAIPNTLNSRQLSVRYLAKLVQWKYVQSATGPMLAHLLQLYTDAMHFGPHWLQLEYFSKTTQVFAYRFSQYRGVSDGTAGAHASELPLLFGRKRGTMQWQTGSGRSTTFSEDRLSLRMKRLWIKFMTTGDPNPSTANDSRLWPLFSADSESVLELFSDPSTGRTMDLPSENPEKSAATLWNELLPSLNNDFKLSLQETSSDVFIHPGDCGPYKSAMFTTLFFLILLIAALVLALVLLKRHISSGRQLTKL